MTTIADECKHEQTIQDIRGFMPKNNEAHIELIEKNHSIEKLLIGIKGDLNTRLTRIDGEMDHIRDEQKEREKYCSTENGKIKETIKNEVSNRNIKFKEVWKVVLANADQVKEWKAYLKIILGIFGLLNIGAIVLALIK